MNATVKSLGIDQLGLENRLALVGEIWDTIAESAELPLTPAQRAELGRRIAEDDANPDDTIAWEEIRAASLARLSK